MTEDLIAPAVKYPGPFDCSNIIIIIGDYRKIKERLRTRTVITDNLKAVLSDLAGRVEGLQEAHEQVKSKSLIMQSLWEGLVTRQVEIFP